MEQQINLSNYYLRKSEIDRIFGITSSSDTDTITALYNLIESKTNGLVTQLTSGTDLDTLINNGWYYVNNIVYTNFPNAPTPITTYKYFLLYVQKGTGNIWEQTLYTFPTNTFPNDDTTQKPINNSEIFYRKKYGGSGAWSEWSKIATTDNIPTKTSQLTNDSGFLTSHNPIDTSLNTTSTNAVQNKVINSALSGKLSLTGGTLTGAVSSNSNITTSGTIQGATIKKTNGTSSQFLKADGSVDENDYYPRAETTGGTNLLPNTQEFTSVSDGALIGEYYKDCAIRQFNNTNGTDTIECMWTNIPKIGEFKQGDKFTLSFWAKGTGTIICYHHGNSGYIKTKPIKHNGSNPSGYSDGHCTFTLTDKWERYYVTWEYNPTANDTSLSVQKKMTIRTQANTNSYICGVMFERGEVAHDWSPAPSDYQPKTISGAASKNVVTNANGEITTEDKLTGSSTNSDIKISNYTGNAGTSTQFAKADHIHPTIRETILSPETGDPLSLDTYKDAGLYKIDNRNHTLTYNTESPSDENTLDMDDYSYGILEVKNFSGNSLIQIIYLIQNNTNSPKIYYRKRYSKWSNWEQITNTNDVETYVDNKISSTLSGISQGTLGTHEHTASQIKDSNASTYTNISSSLSNTSTQQDINNAINTKISSLTNIDLVKIVTTTNLPTASASTMNQLYLKTKTDGTTNDAYNIYVTVKNGSTYSWEKIDDFDLQLPTIDSTVADNANHLITSQAVYNGLNGKLSLTGGTLTGNVLFPIESNSASNTATGNIPWAGSPTYSTDLWTTLKTKKSGMFTFTDGNKWWNVISNRHRNGSGDGYKCGLYLRSTLQDDGHLLWAKQKNESSFMSERTILDSYNYSDYANKTTIANNLTTTTAGSALDATQGKNLNDILSPFKERYDGTDFAASGNNIPKQYFRLCRIQYYNGATSSNVHLNFEILDKRGGNDYFHFDINGRYSYSKDSTTGVETVATNVKVNTIDCLNPSNLNKIYFCRYNEVKNSYIDVYFRIDTIEAWHLSILDDHTMSGSYELFSPVKDSRESYAFTNLDSYETDLNNAGATISNNSSFTYTEIKQGEYNLTVDKISVDGGTSSQFLKADGSVDSNAYANSTHSHGNITNDGKITALAETINGVLVPDLYGVIGITEKLPISKVSGYSTKTLTIEFEDGSPSQTWNVVTK